jgi:N-acetyl-anhydromuramyl-L-alanine amidase AmpD
MIDITDKKFWDKVNAMAPTAYDTVKAMFAKADSQPLTVEEAESCLDALLVYSHARIIENSKALKQYYPTVQFTKNRLLNTESLWWTDHYTGGINEMSTLAWFSAKKVTKKDGKVGLPGASTHFVLGRHGYPYYIIPIWHGAWHEPARNADSLSIELVNPGALKPDGNNWARSLGSVPPEMVAETPPARIQPPYRGASWLMPFTVEQVANLIRLKRIVLALRVGRLVRERMTQHSVWRETKIDMGPLFPLEDVNRAAFEFVPVDQYAFMQKLKLTLPPGIAAAPVPNDQDDEAKNEEHGFDTPTHDDDPDPQPKILGILEVQKILATKGVYRGALDGVYGPQTKQAVILFQSKWNSTHPKGPKLDVDGIPGPMTCKALQTQ